MSGDYSKIGFKPRKRFAGVLMQQGRVQLDSDWNEGVDIHRERVRLLSLDNFGPVGVPYLTTPDAFRLGLVAGPPADLTIEPGRLYVDGLLAELFADEGATYLDQPFLPDPPPLPAGDSLAFLDVWEREVTYVEDAELLEVALGGADTATRVQTVWQLRVSAVRDAACGMDVGEAPSAGRLTTLAVAPPTPDDPCILPPVAGYRGLENRLYRVEIHQPGPLGTARFKWSRDNGSIVSVVTDLAVAGAQTTLTVNRVGRDEVMRFRIGDWVTVTDDHRELMGEAGEMALIVDIEEADRQLVLDRALPTGGGRPFGGTAAQLVERHTRVQRWDGNAALNPVDGDGLLTTAAGPIDLEAGIQLNFSTDPAGGSFRTGDYWVFWARTATARIEELNAAPPRGIHHHYVQLGAISGLGSPTPDIDDCRPPPPTVGRGESCCTFVVRPGEPIQDAIDALPPAGGCVCLKAGLHLVPATIVIDRDNVTLHGESLGATLANSDGATLLRIGGARGTSVSETRVSSIVFQQGPARDPAAFNPIISLSDAESTVIDDCRLENVGRGTSTGLNAAASRDIQVCGCAFRNVLFGALFANRCADVTVSNCEFVMRPGQRAVGGIAVWAIGMSGPVTAEGNRISDASWGIVVNDNPFLRPASGADRTRVWGNRISLAPAPVAIVRAFGIDVAAPESIVGDNQIVHRGGNCGGIRLCGDGSSACGNVIRCEGEGAARAIAIVAGHDGQDGLVPLARVVIADNIVEGTQHGVTLVGVAHGRVSGNILGSEPMPFGNGVTLDRSSDCMVAENAVAGAAFGLWAFRGFRNSICDNRMDRGGFGVVMGIEEAPTIRGNRLTDLTGNGIILFGGLQRCNLIENRIVRCGSAADIAWGIAAFVIIGELHVESNEVMDTGLTAPGVPAVPLAYGIAGELILEARIEGNLVTYSNAQLRADAVQAEDRALRLRGLWEVATLGGDGPVLGFAVQVADNKFIGPGISALVELRQEFITLPGPPPMDVPSRFERVLLSGNYCFHYTPREVARGATVSLFGRHCTISGNQVKATTRRYPSYDLHDMPGPFIGNVSHAGHSGRLAQFPNPESAFNTNA